MKTQILGENPVPVPLLYKTKPTRTGLGSNLGLKWGRLKEWRYTSMHLVCLCVKT